MNLAIVIGVSGYNTLSQLPACKNDSVIMKLILQESKRFDEILYINENTTAQNIRNKIIDFIQSHKANKEIEELFFYFSGHGWFEGNDFYYICSNFDSNKINTTTIKNTELDEMLKELSPNLAIKVVDACQSGTRYIKDSFDEEVIKGNMKSKYKNCYFMFSSQQDQKSYADKEFSIFTKSFADSIINFEGNKMLYRDVMNYITDEFKVKNIEQQPFYVTQSTNMEYFLENVSEFKERLKSSIESIKIKEDNREDIPSKEQKDIVQLLKKKAEKYCSTTEEILEIFDYIYKEFEGFYLEDDISSIYDVKIKKYLADYRAINSIDKVTNALNKDEYKDFIIEFISKKEKRKKKVPKENTGSISFTIQKLRGEIEYEEVEEDVDVIYSYKISMNELKYNCIDIQIDSKLPNVPSIQCKIIFAFSRKKLIISYYLEKYEETSWDYFEIPNDVKWKMLIGDIKDKSKIKGAVITISDNIRKYVDELITKAVEE